ncbi:MAG: hypothetical protein AB7T10_04195 [bacterium]
MRKLHFEEYTMELKSKEAVSLRRESRNRKRKESHWSGLLEISKKAKSSEIIKISRRKYRIIL